MDNGEPALFDAPPSTTPPENPPAECRGTTGETYRRTVVADLTVTDFAELRDSALRYFDDSGFADEGMFDDEELGTDSRAEIAASDAVALSWVIAPTEYLWDLVQARAIKVTDTSVEIDQSNPDLYRATWEVTIKLLDADGLRKRGLANTGPDLERRAEVDQSLAAAWNAAVPPDQPLRRVGGISWTLNSVDVEQVFDRPNGADVLPG